MKNLINRTNNKSLQTEKVFVKNQATFTTNTQLTPSVEEVTELKLLQREGVCSVIATKEQQKEESSLVEDRNDAIITEHIAEEFTACEHCQPLTIDRDMSVGRIETPFSYLEKRSKKFKKYLSNQLTGNTACGLGKQFGEPHGGNEEDNYCQTKINKE